MEWTDEVIARLKELWNQGLSTAEIGRQLSITKNAVVGKAHRLGLPARPSPIRRDKPEGHSLRQVMEKKQLSVSESESYSTHSMDKNPSGSNLIKPMPVELNHATANRPLPKKKAIKTGDYSRRVIKTAFPDISKLSSPMDNAARKHSSRSNCCWPIGDPGTRGFHYCGKSPLPGKPYCAEHAAVAYVKLRDRRDNATE